MALSLRGDLRASRWRGLAKNTKDGPQVRRLLALAAIYVGAMRRRSGGVELQIIWVWVLRFTARRPNGLLNGNAAGPRAKLNDSRRQSIARMIKSDPIPIIHGVVRWWLAVQIQPNYDPTMVIVTAAH